MRIIISSPLPSFKFIIIFILPDFSISNYSLTKTCWFGDFGEFVSHFKSLTLLVSVRSSHPSMSVGGY